MCWLSMSASSTDTSQSPDHCDKAILQWNQSHTILVSQYIQKLYLHYTVTYQVFKKSAKHLKNNVDIFFFLEISLLKTFYWRFKKFKFAKSESQKAIAHTSLVKVSAEIFFWYLVIWNHIPINILASNKGYLPIE